MKNIFNFKFIKIIAYNSASKLYIAMNKMNSCKRIWKIFRYEFIITRYRYYYGFNIIYGGLIKIMLLSIMSLILGIFYETLIVTLVFISIRAFAGGYHMKSYTFCTYFSLSVLLLLGICAKIIFIFGLWNFDLFLIVYILNLILIFKYAPVENKNRPLKTQEIPIKKMISVSIVCLQGLLMWFVHDRLFIISSCMGNILATIILLPKINKILNQLEDRYKALY